MIGQTGLSAPFSSIGLLLFQGGLGLGLPPSHVGCTRKSCSAHRMEPFVNGSILWALQDGAVDERPRGVDAQMVQRPLVLELEGAQLAGAAVAVGLGAELGDEDRLARIERVRAVEERAEVDGPRRAAGPGGAIPAEVLVGADYVQPLDGWGGVGLTEDRLAVDADPAAGIEAADRRAGLVDEDLVVPLGGLVEEGAAGVLAGDLVGHRPGED